MKLAQELKALDTITEKLNIYLAGLRAEGPLEGALEYAQSEAEAIAGRVSFLAMQAERGGIPDADFEGPKGKPTT